MVLQIIIKKNNSEVLAHRIVRIIIKIYKIKDKVELLELIKKISTKLKNSYDGEKILPMYKSLKA